MNNNDFIQQLNEGGNMSVVDADGNIVASAEPIDMKKFNRTDLKNNIIKLLKKIDSLYNQKYKEPLWNNFKVVESGYSFSGSTEYVFDKNISDEEFVKYKPEIGDIDVIIDDTKTDNFVKLMDGFTGKNVIPSMECIGLTKAPAMTAAVQKSYIFKYTQNKYSVMIQIDFELQPFEDDAPNTWAKFSHSSNWQDLKEGIKGAFHKRLLESIVNSAGTDGKVLVVTPKSPIDKLENMKFTKDSETKDLSKLTFTNDSGLRTKLAPLLDKNGKPFKKGDKIIYRELSSKESSYEKDLNTVFSILFGKQPTSTELKDMYSYVGMLKLIKKYITNSKKLNIITDNFVRKTGADRTGQKFASTPEKDMAYRLAAWNKYNSILGNQLDIAKMQKDVTENLYPQLFRDKKNK